MRHYLRVCGEGEEGEGEGGKVEKEEERERVKTGRTQLTQEYQDPDT